MLRKTASSLTCGTKCYIRLFTDVYFTLEMFYSSNAYSFSNCLDCVVVIAFDYGSKGRRSNSLSFKVFRLSLVM